MIAATDLKISVAAFDSLTDTTPKQWTLTWPELVKMLSTFRTLSNRNSGNLWSPAIYREGGTRCNEDVVAISCLVFDFDRGTPEALADSLDGTAHIIHSTYHSTPDKPRRRLVIPFATPCPADRWTQVWRRLADHFGAATTDESCKDASRGYFLPAHPPGAEDSAFVSVQDGEPLEWEPYAAEAGNGAAYQPTDWKRFRLPDKMTPGDRYPKLFSLAGKLRQEGFGEDEIYAALVAANRRCVPPKDDQVLRDIARNVQRYAPDLMRAAASKRLEPPPTYYDAAVPYSSGSVVIERQWQPVSAAELAVRPVEAVQWLAEPFLAAGKLTLLAAPPGRGKSWVGMGALAAVCEAEDFLGVPTNGPVAGLLVDEEMGESELARRIHLLQCSSHRFYILSRQGLCLSDPKQAKQLLTLCQDKGIGAVALDSYRRLLRGSEDDSETANRFYAAVAPILEAGIAVLLVHHTRKRGLVHQPGEMQRGSGDLTAQCDVYIEGAASKAGMRLDWRKVRFGPAPDPATIRVVEVDGRIELVSEAATDTGGTDRREEVASAVLAAVRETPGLSQSKLAGKVGASTRTVARVCEQLCDGGLIILRQNARSIDAYPAADDQHGPLLYGDLDL